MKNTIAATLLALALASCGVGSAGSNNVSACKNFLASAKCGTYDVSAAFNCDAYANSACDVSAYFDCAATHYVCSNGMYDQTKLDSFSADCAAKAVCK
jgi:hypothetical protein